VANARAAIVIEKIVFVIPVFRKGIVFKEIEQRLFFRFGEIQYLPFYPASFYLVDADKPVKGGYIKNVIQLPASKFHIEIRRVKIESTIIVNPVKTGGAIADVYCTMTESGVQIFTRSAGNQRYFSVLR